MPEMKLGGFLVCEREIKLKGQIRLQRQPQSCLRTTAMRLCVWSLLPTSHGRMQNLKHTAKMVVLQLSDWLIWQVQLGPGGS